MSEKKTRSFKQVNRMQVSMKKDLKGLVEGTYQGFIEKEIKDKSSGELKHVKSFNFDEESGRLLTVLGDAGLAGEIVNSGIEIGDYVRITHQGEKDLGGGKKINLYLVEKAS